MKKRIFSIVLCLSMILGIIPATGVTAKDSSEYNSSSSTLVCGKEEVDAHTHTDECYQTSENVVCGKEEHNHDVSCYTNGELTCTTEQHVHTPECYRTLICGKTETEGHTHSAECYQVQDNEDKKDGKNDDASVSAMPTEEKSLDTVIGKDNDGNSKMYTTLYDSQNRVVSTNDSQVTQDDFYANGGTVDLEASLYVKFRMEEIIPHSSNQGIQEDITYYMNTLPKELVPTEKDKGGNVILNLDEPSEFFKIEGSVGAYGGIYGTTDDYKLKMCFTDVEDKIDVSGTFQYNATVNKSLTPGNTYTLNYVPGGSVSFTVTPKKEEPSEAQYTTFLSGGQGGPQAYFWQAYVGKKNTEGTDEYTFPYHKMTITSDDKFGFWIDQANPTIFTGYGDNSGPEFSITVRYNDDSGTTQAETVKATSSNIIKNEAGQTVVRLKGSKLQADVTFSKDTSTEADSIINENNGKYSFITRQAVVDISDGNGGEPKNIVDINLTIPTLPYDDYQITGSKSYNGKISLTDADDKAKSPDISGQGSCTVSYGSLSKPTISNSVYGVDASNNDFSKSYEYFYDKIYTYYNTSTGSYFGNYYWVDYDPSTINTANLNYYLNNLSFVPNGTNNKLISTSGYSDIATFTNKNAGTFLTGMVTGGFMTDWDCLGTIQVGQILYGTSFMSQSCFSSGDVSDAKLQYQLKKVFADASDRSNDYVVVYRSSQKHSNGEYVYIIVDPNTTTKAATANQQYGYKEYIENVNWTSNKGGSAKPASYRLHIFNAPGTLFVASQFQSLGGFITSDETKSGSIANSVSTGIGTSQASKSSSLTGTSSISTQQYSAASLTSQWLSDDTIFWQMTFNAKNLPGWTNGYLYFGTSDGVYPDESGQSVVGDQTLSNGTVYVKSSDGTWKSLNTKNIGYNLSSDYYQGNISDLNYYSTLGSKNYSSYYVYDYEASSNLKDYAYTDKDLITVGFITKVNSTKSSSECKLSAEIVATNGEVARFDSTTPSYGTSSYSLWPYKISATATAPIPDIKKTGTVIENDDATITKAAWELTPTATLNEYGKYFSTPLLSDGYNNYYGGYGGVLRFADTMKNSTTISAMDKVVEDANPGKYTHITKLINSSFSITEVQSGGSCGPIPYADESSESGYAGDTSWQKYVNGSWAGTGSATLWDPYSPGIYRRQLASKGTNTDEVWIYVYYAGDMYNSVRDKLGSQMTEISKSSSDKSFDNSLVFEVTGLKKSWSNMSPIYYETETDNQEICEVADKATNLTDSQKLASYYDTELKNDANLGIYKVTNRESTTASLHKRVSAQLSIEKTAESADNSSNGYSCNFGLKITNGFTDTSYIATEDYLTEFANVERKLDMYKNPTPIEGGSYDAETSGDAVKEFVNYLGLEDITIKYCKSGESEDDAPTIYSNGNFVDDWAGSTFELSSAEGYQSDKPGSLFKANFVPKEGEVVDAGASFIVSYKAVLNMDTPLEGQLQTFRESEYYLGQGFQVLNSANASRQYEQITTASVEQPEGTVDGLTLTVDCGGNASAVYLAKDNAQKTHISYNDGIEQWLYNVYTGTIGKNSSTFTIVDSIQYMVESFTYTDKATGKKVYLSSLSQENREQLKTFIEHIVEKNTIYSNLKVYIRDNTASKYDDLSDDELVWNPEEFTSTGGTEIKSAATDASGVKDVEIGTTPNSNVTTFQGTDEYKDLTMKLESIPATLSYNEEGKLIHGHLGYSISAQGLPLDKYLVSTYDTYTNWNAVAAEITEYFGSYTLRGHPENNLEDDTGEVFKSSIGSTVYVEDSTLNKQEVTSNKKEGTATWRITANTGSITENSLNITDSYDVTLPEGVDESVRTAAEAATSIDSDSIKITKNGAVIYKNGAAYGGWTDQNISVNIDGKNMTILLRNSDDNTVLGKNQSYVVEYNTVFDKNAYITNGGKSGDTYTLVNNVNSAYGGVKLNSKAEDSFAPEAPISATKEVEGTFGNTASWKATASSNGAKRTGFVMTDSVTTEDGAAADAISIEKFDIVINNGDGTEERYSSENLPQGATLKDANGGEFVLSKPGVSSFELKLPYLDANKTVEIYYTTKVDHEIYIANGGQEGSKITLSNAFNASSDDGYSASDNKQAKVEIKEGLTKNGKTLTETTDDGKPIVEWDVDVALTQTYTAEQLQNMKEVTITDRINPLLAYIDGSIKVTDASGNDVPYELTTENRTVKVTIKDPSNYPNVHIAFKTKCNATVDNLVNTVELSVDGTVVDKKESPSIDKINVGGQYGTIKSASKPSFTPVAYKYVDNEICTESGKFEFEITEVDENGNALTGEDAYSEVKSNDGNGKIEFSEIKYNGETTRYYQIKEIGESEYIQDDRIFTVMVTVVRAEEGYVTDTIVLEPENYSEVRFDNTSKPKTTDFTVTKVWDDNNNESGNRPSDVLVYLYQNGEPYNNTTVTLSEANDWTYTWTGLPVAGGDYSVVEGEVSGYESNVSITDNNAVITNKLTEDTRPTDEGKGETTDSSDSGDTELHNIPAAETDSAASTGVSDKTPIFIVIAVACGVVIFAICLKRRKK